MNAWAKSLAAGVLGGMIWFLAQFTLSELSYQIALNGIGGTLQDSETLYDISDTIAFPAGIFYEKLENHVLHSELQQLDQSNDLNQDERKQVTALLNRFSLTKDADLLIDDAYAFMDEQGITAEVSTFHEYGIYIGVCLIWGIVIAAVLTVFSYSMAFSPREVAQK